MSGREFSNNKITRLFEIKYPIIQAGMIWCSGWELASAVAEAGGLGLIGSGSMSPDVLREHIQKCKSSTTKPFGVNLPLLYPRIEEQINVIIDEEVKIVFSSAGNPATWTPILKERGIKVIHVVSNTRFAKKAEDAGVDAIVAEGFEAGGHNGREEITTLCLIPQVNEAVQVPLIAAGGIGSGATMMAAMAMGADAVQIGSRFVTSYESSAHENFKKSVVEAGESDTLLTLKEITPVRLLRNKFFNDIQEKYANDATIEELKELLGKGRSKKGMFEGNLEDGELEIGQISGWINKIQSASEIIDEIINGYFRVKENISKGENQFA